MNNLVSDSRFQMWRCLVALVHTDHNIMQEERDFFLDRFDTIRFSEEQKDIIRKELNSSVRVETMFKGITDKEDRATLIYFARLLFWCDGEFDHQEEKMLKHLHEAVISKIELATIMKDVNDATQEIMKRYDAESSESNEDSNLLSAFSFALKAGLWPARDVD